MLLVYWQDPSCFSNASLHQVDTKKNSCDLFYNANIDSLSDQEFLWELSMVGHDCSLGQGQSFKGSIPSPTPTIF